MGDNDDDSEGDRRRRVARTLDVVLRRFLTPRWLGIHALAVLAIVACVLLALWQWDRADQQAAADRERLQSEATPLADVVDDAGRSVEGDDVSRLVSVTGAYLAERQVLVVDKELDGRDGFWVVTPIESADVVALVVRGWVGRADAAATEVPTGEVTVTGRLTPSDPPGGAPLQGSAELPEDRVSAVSSIELSDELDLDLVPGYVVLTDQEPAAAAAPTPVEPPVPFSVSGGLLQHWSYVAQWLLFAGFVVFFWWRLARDELRRTSSTAAAVGDKTDRPEVSV